MYNLSQCISQWYFKRHCTILELFHRMAAWISPDVKSFGCVNTFSIFLKCIGFLFHFKKKACKWITSIGWTGHLRGVQGLETLRWFTIWGKQIGSDNTGWSMLPNSPTGNVSGRLGNYYCKPFFKFWVSLTSLSSFSWRTENWENEDSFFCSEIFFVVFIFYIGGGKTIDWLDHLTNWPNGVGKCEHILF